MRNFFPLVDGNHRLKQSVVTIHDP